MSDRITLLQHRLDNWGRYVRDDDPHLWYPSKAAAFGDMLYESTDREGWGEETRPAFLPAIDVHDARRLDGHILDLSQRHRACIKHWYYELRRRLVCQEDHDAAVRALADRVERFTKPLQLSGISLFCTSMGTRSR